VTIPVELTERDVLGSHLWTLFQLPGVRLLLGTNLLFILLASLFVLRALVHREMSWPLITALLVPALVLALFLIQVGRFARRRFRALTSEQKAGTYCLDEEGLEWSLGRAPGKIPWSVVVASGETGRAFYLMTPSARTHVLPKREMTEDDVTDLRRLLQAKSLLKTNAKTPSR
jgi:hypothetical protein